MSRDDRLPQVDVEGVQRVTLPREGGGRLPRGTKSTLTSSGLVARSHLRELTLWNPWTSATRDVTLPFAPVCIDAHGDFIACVDQPLLLSPQVVVFDLEGREQWRVKGDQGDTTVRFAADGALWTMSGTQLRLFRAGQEVGAPRVLDDRKEIAPRWMLDAANPSRPMVAVSAGAGQDDAFFRLASPQSVTPAVSGLCFAGWSRDGSSYATLPHHGALLCICDTDSGLMKFERELDEVLEALDDGHEWQVELLSEASALLPTSEGRLLRVGHDIDELVLESDERNWNWEMVLANPDGRLVTWRLGDDEYRVWRLSGLAARST